MPSSVLEADGLTVRREGNAVLNDISFAVRAGEITGLLGPSGCGKTTLMRAVLGVQRISAGTLTVLDRPAGTPALRTEVGYAAQQAAVYVDLSVAGDPALLRHGRRRAGW